MRLLWIILLISFPISLCAQWGPDIKLSTNEVSANLNENMGQCLIASGNILYVVWSDNRTTESVLYFKRSPDAGQTWSADTRLSPSPGSDTFPLIAYSSSTLHLVFLRDNGTTAAASIYKRSTDGGSTWSPDVFLGYSKWWPGVAAVASNVYVSMNTDVGGNSEVFFRLSTDGGVTWQPQQQLSNALGRSEDPAITAAGSYVHLGWNDNRDTSNTGGMAYYYRRSPDSGATWGPETALTHSPENTYCPGINSTGSDLDIAYADRQTGFFNIYHEHSTNSGTTWDTKQQLTSTTVGELYPAILRDGQNVHTACMAALSPSSVHYRHSGDGGTTWDPVVILTTDGSFPFLAVSGQALHMIFVSNRDGHKAIYYKRNLTGNPASSSVSAWNRY